MKKFIKTVIASVVLIALGGTAVYAYYQSNPNTVVETKEVQKIEYVEIVSEVSGENIENQLNRLGELVSQSYSYKHLEYHKSHREEFGITIPWTESYFAFTYTGTIKAGINFEEVTIGKDDESKIINVHIPEAYIISSSYDPESFELIDEKNNIFNPISVPDVNEAISNMVTTEEEMAVENGLLTAATDNAKLMIKNMILGLVSDYEIIFTN